MRLPKNLFGVNRGSTGNSFSEGANEIRRIDALLAGRPSMEIAVVKRYNHDSGTVDVVHKANPAMQSIRNVPIWGLGGNGWRMGYGLRGADESGVTEPDVGMLFYPHSDSTRLLENFLRRLPFTKRKGRPVAPIFVAGLPVDIQSGPTDIEAGDLALVDAEGSGMVLKHPDNTGGSKDLIIRADRVYILGANQSTSDAKAIARTGDAGDGGTGATTIQGGSSKIFSG